MILLFSLGFYYLDSTKEVNKGFMVGFDFRNNYVVHLYLNAEELKNISDLNQACNRVGRDGDTAFVFYSNVLDPLMQRLLEVLKDDWAASFEKEEVDPKANKRSEANERNKAKDYETRNIKLIWLARQAIVMKLEIYIKKTSYACNYKLLRLITSLSWNLL